jgi:hypothetical protein
MDLRIGQPTCCGLCCEPFFSGAVTLSSAVDDVRMVAICGPREVRMVLDHTRTERGERVECWSGFLLQGVHRFELPRLSNMSKRFFVVVITWIT